MIKITTINSLEVISGVNEMITIQGIGFGESQNQSYVTFKNPSGEYYPREKARSFQYEYWSDTEIKLIVPVISDGKLIVVKECESQEDIIPKVVLDRNSLVLINQNSKGGYTWHINEELYRIPECKIAILEVFEELRKSIGVNFDVDNDLTVETPENFENNDTNVIGFETYTDGGTISFYRLKWIEYFCPNHHFTYPYRMSISFKRTAKWYFGKGKVPDGFAKFRYALMHELGHALGLGHVNVHGQTMFGCVAHDTNVDIWNERDWYTDDEVDTMRHYVKLSQSWDASGCNLSPMKEL